MTEITLKKEIKANKKALKEAREEYIAWKMAKACKWCLRHKKIVIMKISCAIWFIFGQPFMYQLAVDRESTNMAHFLGLVVFILLISGKRTWKNFFGWEVKK